MLQLHFFKRSEIVVCQTSHSPIISWSDIKVAFYFAVINSVAAITLQTTSNTRGYFIRKHIFKTKMINNDRWKIENSFSNMTQLPNLTWGCFGISVVWYSLIVILCLLKKLCSLKFWKQLWQSIFFSIFFVLICLMKQYSYICHSDSQFCCHLSHSLGTKDFHMIIISHILSQLL